AYNMPKTIPLVEKPDREKLENTIVKLIQRHESLRTSFHIMNEEPVQVIHDTITFNLDYYELDTGLNKDRNLHSNKNTEAGISIRRPFDISQAPLLRVALIKNGDIDSRYLMLMDMHHIISDGISHEILHNDFNALYMGNQLPPLRIQYKDYSQWQHCENEKGNIKNQETYWLKQFEDDIPALALPLDYPRPAIQRFEGDSVTFYLSGNEAKTLKNMALSAGTTSFMMLLSVFNILLGKLDNREDIIVGTPVAGRRHADLEKVIGMFVNTLAIRNFPKGENTFDEFLEEVKIRTLEAFDNQDYQFEELVDNVSVNRDTGRNPLFDVMFALHTTEGGNTQSAAGSKAPAQTENGEKGSLTLNYEIPIASKFDMTLTAVESTENIVFNLTYNTALFKKKTAKRFAGYFKRILSAAVARQEIKLSGIRLLSRQEEQRILYEFNDTGRDFPREKTIPILFAEQAQRTSGNIAIKNPVTILSYGELDQQSSRLAASLRRRGIGNGDIVAVMCDASLSMLKTILAILKVGAVYLPVDSEIPKGRLDYLLSDSQAKLLLARNLPTAAASPDIACLNPEAPELYTTGPETTVEAQQAGPHDPVYTIYTSGTTGRPKGVLLTHSNLVNYVEWFSNEARVTGEDKTLLVSSVAFDLGYTAVYPSLLKGAQLHLLPKEIYRNPDYLLNYITQEGITYLKLTPSFFSIIVPDNRFNTDTISRLRLVVLGGEAIQTGDVETALNKCTGLRIMNHYGPTEVTIGCIARYIEYKDLETYKTRPTIGKPINNTQVYILDKHSNQQPIGIAGELCLSGVGLARGYLNNPQQTAEKFMPGPGVPTKLEEKNPHWEKDKLNAHDLSSKRRDEAAESDPATMLAPVGYLYRTGDLGRWLEDGNIEFLGRIDSQVKIRGYRIELREIEHVLTAYQGVREVVVLARGNDKYAKDKYLSAYIVPDTYSGPDTPKDFATALRRYLSSKLPEYMIPVSFTVIEKIPLTANGKIDTRALPDTVLKTAAEQIAPRNPVEEILAEIWTEVLMDQTSIEQDGEKQTIGIDDNFFHLGGHSLKATVLTLKIHKRLNVKIPLTEVFKTPTIRVLAAYINSHAEETFVSIQPAEKKSFYPLSSA
ncbi:MAG: amino acid adenylation domain-containing protein, partial [bacterium]|nr:amino acid adenylation domain-containing protein [bacterium]